MDHAWQETTRKRLRNDSQRLADTAYAPRSAAGRRMRLFQWVRTSRALTNPRGTRSPRHSDAAFRSCSQPALRASGSEHEWALLERVLSHLRSTGVTARTLMVQGTTPMPAKARW